MTACARLIVALSVVAASASEVTARQAGACREPTYKCAAAQVERGEFDAAIESLTAVLERAPRNANARHLLGIALTASGRIDEANRQYLAALDADPAFYPAARNLGI